MKDSAEEQRLERISTASRALQVARTIEDVKQIRDKAEAIRLYMKQQQQSLKSQNDAAELKIRAERRLGEMLAETEREQGKRTDLTSRHDVTKLQEIGIHPKQGERWQQEAIVPEKVVNDYIAECNKTGQEVTSAGVLRLREKLRPPQQGITEPLPSGKFACIVVDPPWHMEKLQRDVRVRQHGFDYPSMTPDQIKDFPIPDISAEDAHLYLWVTQKYLPDGLEIAESWGFKYQCLITWVKNVGFTPFSWMYSTEHVIFARRGGLDLLKLGVRLDFSAKVREHSRKPDEFYDIVRAVSPGPRIDVFSREKQDGFDQYGNETRKF